jgi:hypothetical protein
MKNSALRDALVSVGLNSSAKQNEERTFHACFKGNSTSKVLLKQGGLIGFDKLGNIGFPSVQAVLDSPQHTQLKSLISKEPGIYFLQDKSSYWLFFPSNDENEATSSVQIDQFNSKRKKKGKKDSNRSNEPYIRLISEKQIRKFGGEFSKEYIASIVCNESFQSLEKLKKSANYWALTLSQRGLAKPVIEVFKSTDGLFRLCEKKLFPSPEKILSPKLKPTDHDNYQLIYDRLHKRGCTPKCDKEITKILNVINDLGNIKDVMVFKERLGFPVGIANASLNKKVNKFYRMEGQNVNITISFIETLLAIDVEQLKKDKNKLKSIKNKITNGTDARSILKERKALPKIGLGLETKFKPERIKSHDVKLDERTKPKHDKHIMYTAGWSLDGAFTKE